MPADSVLLVSPVPPAATGYGLAMRAGLFLDALAADADVTLLEIPLFDGEAEPSAFVRERARRIVRADLGPGLDPLYALSSAIRDPGARLSALLAYPRPAPCRFATSRTHAALVDALGADVPRTVVVLRSYLAPYAMPFLGARSVLDLDDDEALTRRRLATLHRRWDRAAEAAFEEAEAAKFEAGEREWLPRFGVVLTTSDAHAARLCTARPGQRFEVVPNAIRPAARCELEAPEAREVRLLFVGNLSYAPNEDAALWLAREILPLLETQGAALTRLRIAGARPGASVRALAGRRGVTVIANPADLEEHYDWAHLAVVPLRAGGGTRIKILEAFAAGVPVVSTTLGAEGLVAHDGEHLLLADHAADFAAACLRLARDGDLRRRLVTAAHRLVAERYDHALVSARIRDVVLSGAADAV